MPNAIDARYMPQALLPPAGARVLLHHREDFLGGLSQTFNLALHDDTSTGSPTEGGVISGEKGGQYGLRPNANNEAQRVGLNQQGVLTLPIDWGVVLTARIYITAVPSNANDIFLFGLATARHDTPDSVSEHLWFRCEGNGNLLVEMDDNGGTDDDDNDTTLDIATGDWVTLAIDTRQRSNVRFWAAVGVSQPLQMVLPATQFSYRDAATGMFQVLAEVQKNSTAQPGFRIDFIDVWAQRAIDTQSTVYPAYA